MSDTVQNSNSGSSSRNPAVWYNNLGQVFAVTDYNTVIYPTESLFFTSVSAYPLSASVSRTLDAEPVLSGLLSVSIESDATALHNIEVWDGIKALDWGDDALSSTSSSLAYSANVTLNINESEALNVSGYVPIYSSRISIRVPISYQEVAVGEDTYYYYSGNLEKEKQDKIDSINRIISSCNKVYGTYYESQGSSLLSILDQAYAVADKYDTGINTAVLLGSDLVHIKPFCLNKNLPGDMILAPLSELPKELYSNSSSLSIGAYTTISKVFPMYPAYPGNLTLLYKTKSGSETNYTCIGRVGGTEATISKKNILYPINYVDSSDIDSASHSSQPLSSSRIYTYRTVPIANADTFMYIDPVVDYICVDLPKRPDVYNWSESIYYYQSDYYGDYREISDSSKLYVGTLDSDTASSISIGKLLMWHSASTLALLPRDADTDKYVRVRANWLGAGSDTSYTASDLCLSGESLVVNTHHFTDSRFTKIIENGSLALKSTYEEHLIDSDFDDRVAVKISQYKLSGGYNPVYILIPGVGERNVTGRYVSVRYVGSSINSNGESHTVESTRDSVYYSLYGRAGKWAPLQPVEFTPHTEDTSTTTTTVLPMRVEVSGKASQFVHYVHASAYGWNSGYCEASLDSLPVVEGNFGVNDSINSSEHYAMFRGVIDYVYISAAVSPAQESERVSVSCDLSRNSIYMDYSSTYSSRAARIYSRRKQGYSYHMGGYTSDFKGGHGTNATAVETERWYSDNGWKDECYHTRILGGESNLYITTSHLSIGGCILADEVADSAVPITVRAYINNHYEIFDTDEWYNSVSYSTSYYSATNGYISGGSYTCTMSTESSTPPESIFSTAVSPSITTEYFSSELSTTYIIPIPKNGCSTIDDYYQLFTTAASSALSYLNISVTNKLPNNIDSYRGSYYSISAAATSKNLSLDTNSYLDPLITDVKNSFSAYSILASECFNNYISHANSLSVTFHDPVSWNPSVSSSSRIDSGGSYYVRGQYDVDATVITDDMIAPI